MKRIPKRVRIPVLILVAALLAIGLAGFALVQFGHAGNGPLPNFARSDSGVSNSMSIRDRDIRSGSGKLGTRLTNAGFHLDELRTAKKGVSRSDKRLVVIDARRGERDWSRDISGRHQRAGWGTRLTNAGFHLDELRTAKKGVSRSDKRLVVIDARRGERDWSRDISGRHQRAGWGTRLTNAGFHFDELRTAKKGVSRSDKRLVVIDARRGERDWSRDISGRHQRAGWGTRLTNAGFHFDELRTAKKGVSRSDKRLVVIDARRGERDWSRDISGRHQRASWGR